MQEKLQLIGVSGTAGAGKDTVADLLSQMFNLRNLSSGDYLRVITRYAYKLPHDFNPARDQLYYVANYLRNEINPATLVQLCILQARAQKLPGVVISGLRSMGEADAIRQAGGIIVGIDTDPRIRYERMTARKRDAEAEWTFEAFVQQDELENKGPSDSGPGRGIRAIIDSADILITNSGDLEELKTELKTKVAPRLR
ncbi:MAG TPA: AAA family ATPase [Patescibacteria group bacterium]|nr:AAA family ATPase [Patescibacteria group bacterium]